MVISIKAISSLKRCQEKTSKFYTFQFPVSSYAGTEVKQEYLLVE